MNYRGFASIVITLFAALAVFYPMTAGIPSSGKRPAPVTASKTDEESPSAAAAAFPTAEALVSEFLFTEKGEKGAPADQLSGKNYTIDFLVATAPDPATSRLPHFFDSFVESLQRAAQAAGYTLDRFAFPW